MARKSKYSSNGNNSKTKIWSTALYIRLSQEDKDNGKYKQESNSVTSQRTILNNFIEENEDLKVYDIYIDDGYSGTDFDRPAFERMVEDIEENKIDCILVKDLSRFGREHVDSGYYIFKYFPLHNIRFIVINDDIDSYKEPESLNTIMVPFKNLINDEYARDTSVKIKTSLESKKKKGDFIGAFSSYGYIKDPKNKSRLIIDEVAADIVKQIFDWYVNYGLGKIAICHRLNDMGILNPTGHKKIELGQNYNNYGIKNNTYTWTPSTIRNILYNEVYLGHTVQGKRRVKSYKIHKVENVQKENWIRVENTHEPIIDKEIFDKAQKLNKKDIKSSQKTGELSIWAGILICKDCGMAMNKKISTNKNGNKYEYYICGTYRKKSNKLCTKHTIKVENISKAVLQAINLHIKLLIDIEKIVKQVNEYGLQNTKTEKIDKIILSKQNEILKMSNYKIALYEDWKNGDITREEYLEYKQRYENDICILKQNIEKLEKEKKENNNEDNNLWIENFKEQKEIKELSRDIVIELIEAIYVHENGNLTVKFKFEDEFKTMLEHIENK